MFSTKNSELSESEIGYNKILELLGNKQDDEIKKVL